MNESETIEFKKSLAELGEGLNSLAAILNKHAAGELWFGIKNDGTPVGMEVTETTLRKVSQSIAAHIEPKIFPQVSNVLLSGKSCIRVSFSGSEKPYYSHGRAYMRVADEDRQLSAKEIESIILRKNRSHRSWDSEPIPDASFKPDAAKVRAYVRKAGLPWTNTPTAIKSLGLHVDGHHLNAARVFFAKPPALALRCAVFATSTTATIIDQHDFNGDILALIEEAEKYILKNIRIGMKLDGLARVDVPEIDREAFREAIINAFCHRDYRDPDEVRIAIFPDRVEVRNPGRLMEGVTLRTLKTAKVSRRRNPLIADLLRRIHLIEAWGRGIPLILEKAPHARFSEIAGVFITEFPRPQAAEDSVTKSQSRLDVTGQVTGQVTRQVSEEVKRLLAIVRKEMSRQEIQSALALRGRENFEARYLKPALEAAFIERTIPDKPNSRLQKYRLTEKGREFAATINPPANIEF
jgi:ATP-dependent DNA helicase RecG